MGLTLRRIDCRGSLAAVLALGGTLALGAAGPAAAAETRILSCPFTITQPGAYLLARSLTCPGSDLAITIAADNVRLDLGGRTLTGDRSSDGIVADGTGDNPITGLRVKNGTLTNFDRGIDLGSAPGARVTGVTVSGSDVDGIEVDDSPGARIVGNTVKENDISGIDAGNCDGCVIAANRIVRNGNRGLNFDRGGSGARIVGNTISRNGSDGIDIEDTGTVDNLIRGNTLTGNGGSGIEVSTGGDGGNRFVGNTATGNDTDGSGEPDLSDGTSPTA
jgi:parallel beta-helix repeat protein